MFLDVIVNHTRNTPALQVSAQHCCISFETVAQCGEHLSFTFSTNNLQKSAHGLLVEILETLMYCNFVCLIISKL